MHYWLFRLLAGLHREHGAEVEEAPNQGFHPRPVRQPQPRPASEAEGARGQNAGAAEDQGWGRGTAVDPGRPESNHDWWIIHWLCDHLINQPFIYLAPLSSSIWA